MIYRVTMLAMLLWWGGNAQAETSFSKEKLQKFSQDYCIKCHDAKRQKGDFNFEPHVAKGDILGERKVWEKIAELLENREMPPEDKPQPTEEERTALIHWIDHELTSGDLNAKDPVA